MDLLFFFVCSGELTVTKLGNLRTISPGVREADLLVTLRSLLYEFNLLNVQFLLNLIKS